jgi:glycosyltransferase involved in cell wall biosynthesis
VKISYFINRPPPFVGGLQNVCLRVAKHFQESTCAEVRIIGFPNQDNSGRRCSWEHEGVDVQELRRGRREDLLLRWVPFLKKRRATLPLAIACYEWAYSRQISRLCRGSLVFHYFGTGMEMNGYAVAKAARALGAKFMVEPAIHEGTWGDSWLDVPLYRMADLMIAHTAHEACLIQNLGVSQEKIQTIVHGVDFCDSGDGARFRKKHRISGPMVLFLGRKTKIKGITRLLEAWPVVAEKFLTATLVLAGSSVWKDDQIENFKSHYQNLGIRDLDDVLEDEKQDALAACDVLCVPSEGESFGMVYFEAWAYRKPVVALNHPCLRESIGAVSGGLLTKPEPSSIAEGLIRLMGDVELRREMGNSGYEFSKKYYWPKALESYSLAYQHAGVFI